MIPKSTRLVRWLAWAGVALILSGVCSFAGNEVWYKTRTWFPLDIPVKLSVGHFATPDFSVNVTETFAIQLEVDREIPTVLTDTVLGTGDPSSESHEARGFNLAWTLSSNGRVVEREVSDGRNQGYWGGRRIGRLLGSFRAEKGKRYRIDLDVLEDGSGLASYHPHLKVGVDLFTLDAHAVGEGILGLVSLGITAIGAALYISAIVLHRQRLARRSTLPVV